MAWNARLSIEYERKQGRSRIRQLAHKGPLVLQKSFYPDDSGLVHNYVLHPPGGLVGGDQLQLDIRLREGAAVLLTTPAAGKIYRTPDESSGFTMHAEVDSGCELQWLPQENIVYEGARHRSELKWTVHPGARLTAWDIQGLGRPGSGRAYDAGCLLTEMKLQDKDRLLFLERQKLDGGSPLLQKAWGLFGHPAMGSMLLYWPDYIFPAAICGDQSSEQVELGISQRDGWLIARARASCPARLKARFLEILKDLYQDHEGRAFAIPRIWAY